MTHYQRILMNYNDIPILHVLEAMLTDAFRKSGADDVVEWLDGKTLHELVGEEIAEQFYDRDPTDFEWVNDTMGIDVLESRLNKKPKPNLVLIEVSGGLLPEGRITFRKGDPDGETWIGSTQDS